MKTVIAAKLKLQTTSEEFAALRAMQLAYRDALNYVSRYAYAYGKKSNVVACKMGLMTRYVPVFICLPKWPVVFPGRLGRPTKPCG